MVLQIPWSRLEPLEQGLKRAISKRGVNSLRRWPLHRIGETVPVAVAKDFEADSNSAKAWNPYYQIMGRQVDEAFTVWPEDREPDKRFAPTEKADATGR